ncbi:hypothetical protein [Nocardia sp. NPDC052566]|uniref:hypothetical protein n=1 Tax=Nocardia sp. NPDC052566 TaxID=3364330 RepID=UPI0037C80273
MRNPMTSTARLRGAFVGSASGAVSVAAHALGGGVVSPTQSSVALLLVACGLVGFAVASIRPRHGLVEMMAMLAVGQAFGHTALALGHHHHGGITAIMLGAHLVAIPAGAVLIRGAEVAIGRAVSSVRQVVRALNFVPAVAFSPASAILTWHGSIRRLLVGSGIGTRGPPIPR